jgi:hypothetical protein
MHSSTGYIVIGHLFAMSAWSSLDWVEVTEKVADVKLIHKFIEQANCILKYSTQFVQFFA